MARPLTIADGQLGTTAATLLAGANAPGSGRVEVLLNNVGTGTETIVLTFQLAGGTARRIRRIVLQPNEGAIATVPLQADDTLLGVTTNASSVDYVIYGATPNRPLGVELYSADGTSKESAILRKILLGVEFALGTEMVDPG